MKLTPVLPFWGSVAALSTILPVVRSDVCMILYQMADNDLESFIRDDLEEYSYSQMIATPSVTTWVYFDNRNFGSDEDIFEPLVNVFNADGSEVTGDKPEGAYYLTYDHGLGKLVTSEDLGEVNSDTAQTVYDFVYHALADCVSAGSNEFFVTFSSHGSGFDGFGGDENIRKQRRLGQANQNIVNALRLALDDNLPAGSKFDVIGFDACLMQAFGAADDYKSVGTYFLASEEVEPGHGWSYEPLVDGSALGIARQIVDSFLNDPQGFQHETPKALSIINFDVYEDFATKWDAFSKVLVALMEAEDPEVSILFNRARQSAYTFASVYDDDGSKDKASVDMMSFMVDFQKLCRPESGSELSSALQEAMTAYDFMFVERGTGPGTPTALTGMHIFWPSKRRYFSGDWEWDDILFDSEFTATTSAPEWLNLLKTYYITPTPPEGGSSVCRTSSAPISNPSEGGLLINPMVSTATDSGHNIATGLARAVDSVLIEFGVDLSFLVDRRQLKRTIKKSGNDEDILSNPRFRNRLLSRRQHHHRRRLDEGGSGNFLYQLSGDLLGTYVDATYDSFWDRTFFMIGDSTTGYSDIYVFDYGEGSKDFPVFYFPPGSAVTSDDVAQMTAFQDAIDAGGQHGYVSFSTQNEVNGVIGGLTLFTVADRETDSFSETPRSRGGQIVPVVYMVGVIDGVDIDYYIGGDTSSVIEWNEADAVGVTPVSASNYVTTFGLQDLTIDMYASDDSTGDSSYAFFAIDTDGEVSLVGEGNVEGNLGGGSGGGGGTGAGSGGGAGSGSAGFSAGAFATLILAHATLWLLPMD